MTNQEILFLPMKKRCLPRGEASVLELALRHRIPLSHSCGGMGSCTTCRVIVESDLSVLPERNELEQEIAESRAFTPQERLSCQLPPLEGLVVRIPLPSRT